MTAEQRADVADDAGLIVVLDDEEGAFQGRLYDDSIDEDHTKAAVFEGGAFDPSITFVRVELYRHETRVIPGSRASRLDELDPALRGDRARVDRRDAARGKNGLEDALEHRAPQQLIRFAGQLSVVPHPDGVDAGRLAHLRYH